MRLKARRYALLEGCPLEVTVPTLLASGGWDAIFGAGAPLRLEIGLGKDPHVIQRALSDPAGAYVGFEYSRKKLDKILSKALASGVTNLRVMRADVREVLGPLFPERCLEAVYILFPDPWPKKRHQKKRLIQPAFVRLLAARMRAGATLELRTDDADYLAQMLAVLGGEPALDNVLGSGRHGTTPLDATQHIATIFERKFRDEGRAVYYLYFTRNGSAIS